MLNFSTLLILDSKTTLWEKPGDQPPGQSNEIIAIDVVLLDTDKLKILEKSQIFIKPKQSKVSNYCETVFGIKQSTIDEQGIPFQEAYRKLRVDFFSKENFWAAWNSFERYILERQCKAEGLEFLCSNQFLNIQYLFRIMTGLSEQPTLEKALAYTGLTNCENNAESIAYIFMRMCKGLRPAIIPTMKQRIGFSSSRVAN